MLTVDAVKNERFYILYGDGINLEISKVANTKSKMINSLWQLGVKKIKLIEEDSTIVLEMSSYV